ncbi:NAD(P)/FAD-dependent oxidoreductase [Streptomyces ureilyticus]|uniref:Ferredoxin--NADP reductase n=1 Tax=Streptomyces ureilyticus TaxID=1775131 RepID=A0ABX0DU24_9ACTN|nr:NAD(P)/FAD-dependent oxidoreductase [Streptomyces ureilyticus]NGO45431.1 NAD(P)/FAD-dependent oxidoreductase [Streptomyces ureilyticus]
MPPPPADRHTDLLIVGAGPTGLFAAYYAGFRGLSVTVLDSLPEPGGQINAMYPEKQIFDIAGFPAVRGRELVDRLLEQAAPYDPCYLLGHRAETMERTTEGAFVVTTHQGARVRARAVIVTGGIGTFTPRPLPAAAAYEGAGLAYFVRRPDDYAGRDVVIVGGGDSAFDWALTLHPLAASVTLVHRRDTFRAHPATVAAVRAAGVEILTEAELTKVIGDGGDGRDIEAVEITRRDGQTYRLPCQGIIAALGFTANLGPLLGWGIDIAHRRHIPVDPAMRTSVPGIYAAGDINDYPGKVRLIAVGFGEAATAVNNAAHHIDPEQPVFPGHSTDVPTAAPAAA